MRLTFTETMSGTLRREGVDHPVQFTVTASDEGKGFFALTGDAEAQPWASGAVTGSLHISLFALERFIRYRVALPGGYSLEGEKTPSPLRPLHSMTHMPVRLVDAGGAVVAEGQMRFALQDLPGFVLSAFPVGR